MTKIKLKLTMLNWQIALTSNPLTITKASDTKSISKRCEYLKKYFTRNIKIIKNKNLTILKDQILKKDLS